MRRKITIPITTTAQDYEVGELLFEPVEIENVSTTLGGNVKIISASLISTANKCPSIDLVFIEESGSIGALPGLLLDNAAFRTLILTKHLSGVITLDEVTDGETGALGTTYISTKSNVGLITSTAQGSPDIDSSDPNSTSFSVFGVARSAVTSTSTTDFKLILDVE